MKLIVSYEYCFYKPFSRSKTEDVMQINFKDEKRQKDIFIGSATQDHMVKCSSKGKQDFLKAVDSFYLKVLSF